MHTLIWMHVSEMLVGITGETKIMRQALAFMSTGTSSEISLLVRNKVFDIVDVKISGALVRVAVCLNGLRGREN